MPALCPVQEQTLSRHCHREKFVTPATCRGSLGLQEQGLPSHQWESQSQSSVPSVIHWTVVPVQPGVKAQAVHWTAPGDLTLVETGVWVRTQLSSREQ